METNNKGYIYIGNALFSRADFEFNEKLADSILEETPHDLYLPQRNTAINDKSKSADSVAIFNGDKAELDKADLMVAVLDGPVIDAGVAAEIGYMVGQGKPVFGLFTDSREASKTLNDPKLELLKDPLESQFPYVNLFVVGAIKENGKIFLSPEELIEYLKKWKPKR